MITTEPLASLSWSEPPLCWLNPDQQLRVKEHAKPQTYKLGAVIWSTETPGKEYLILSGNVRLVPDSGQTTMLKAGDWFGDLPQLTDQWKARASSKEVTVLEWDSKLWEDISTTEVKQFWAGLRSRYQPQFTETPQPIVGYPYIASVHTAAACLTMLAQYLEAPTQLDWVQRQLRGNQPKHVVDAAEKVGIQLRRLLIRDWSDLRQVTFPALMQWQQSSWWVVYGVRGDRLVVADPQNPNQTTETIPRTIIEPVWDGQLWQAEQIQTQEKFSLKWFLPAVLKYRYLLGEVLLASFTLQLIGVFTPIITQVIIDKVMVQESIATLEVMGVALLAIAVFEAVLGILRMFIFTHTTNRLDMALSAQKRSPPYQFCKH